MSAKPPAPDGKEGGFLARWSRRKQESTEVPERATAAEPPPAPPPTVEDEPEVPLEELPPLESIDANTDLRPLLKRRLPPAWRQAALRRVWAADPAIRGFKGLAEYDWDFTIGGDAPGFGPLRSPADARLLLARMLGTAAPEPAERPEAPRSAATPDPASPAAEPPPGAQNGEPPADVAVQNDLRLPTTAQNDKEDEVKPRQRRRGGSATPR